MALAVLSDPEASDRVKISDRLKVSVPLAEVPGGGTLVIVTACEKFAVNESVPVVVVLETEMLNRLMLVGVVSGIVELTGETVSVVPPSDPPVIDVRVGVET